MWNSNSKRDRAAFAILILLLILSTPVRKNSRSWFWNRAFKWLIEVPLMFLYAVFVAIPFVILRAAKRFAWKTLGWDQLGKGTS